MTLKIAIDQLDYCYKMVRTDVNYKWTYSVIKNSNKPHINLIAFFMPMFYLNEINFEMKSFLIKYDTNNDY